VSFIHELTHLRTSEAPGFRLAWNLLVGVPFWFLAALRGVHNLHHGPPRYGSPGPGILPLATARRGRRWRSWRWRRWAFGALIRFGCSRSVLRRARLRETVVSRFSAMCINPAFRRADLDRARTLAGGPRRRRLAVELALVAMVARGGRRRGRAHGIRADGGGDGAEPTPDAGGHAWASDGRPMTVTQHTWTRSTCAAGLAAADLGAGGLRYHACTTCCRRSLSWPRRGAPAAGRPLPPDRPIMAPTIAASRRRLGPALAGRGQEPDEPGAVTPQRRRPPQGPDHLPPHPRNTGKVLSGRAVNAVLSWPIWRWRRGLGGQTWACW